VGFDGAPRLFGIDERGREILSFVEGEVHHDHDKYRPSEAKLTRVAALIRRFHQATAGSALSADAEIVAHNELGPHNTVFCGDEPVAFIDEIHADLRRARANHERAGRPKARNIFQEMVAWMDAHANELKKLV